MESRLLRGASVRVVLVAVAVVLASAAVARADVVHVTVYGDAAVVGGGGGACVVSNAPDATTPHACDFQTESTNSCSPTNQPCVYQLIVSPVTGWAFSSWDTMGCSGTAAQCAENNPCAGMGSVCVYSHLFGEFPENVIVRMTDTRAPTITSVDGPAENAVNVSPNASATFTFHTNEDPLGETATFACALDQNTTFTPCPRTYTTPAGLTNHAHTLYVKATDSSGNIGPPFTRTWDNEQQPTVVFDQAPGAFSASTTAAFAWHDVRLDATFSCRFDSTNEVDFSSGCVSPRTFPGLAQGAHHFDVRATFTAADLSVHHVDFSRTFTVDTIPPDTRLDSGPPAGVITSESTATFAFTGLGGASGFQCSLDGRSYAACGSPAVVRGLGVGTHSFSVRAVDAAGNVDPSPASDSWRVTADADGDGFPPPADCNDANPSIHPNAPDKPGDHIDQNCDGHDARFPAVSSDVSAGVVFFRTFTQVTSLTVTHVAKGMRIKLACSGHGCPFKRKTVKVKKKASKLKLVGLVRKGRFGNNAKLTVTVSQSAHAAHVVTFTFKLRHPPAKRVECLQPGAKKPGRCG